MQVQTLEELKAENAEIENTQITETAKVDDETQIETAEETAAELEIVAEQSTEEDGVKTVEAWMQTDDESDSEKKFSDHDMASARKKLQAKAEKKLTEKDGEIETLRQEIQALKQPVVREQPSAMPKLEDFDYDDDKHAQAVQSWVQGQVAHQMTTTSQKVQQDAQIKERQKALDDSVNSHYERAAKLAAENSIDAEVYKASDLSVRQAIAAVPHFQQSADLVTDQLISLLGEGSEKVMFHLGRNNAARNNLISALQSDPTGVKAGILLGELKAKISQPVKKISSAPKPAKKAEGDGQSPSASNFKRKYDKAKNGQERFNIRREAKRAGEDVSNW